MAFLRDIRAISKTHATRRSSAKTFSASSGSASTPSFSFNPDEDTGIYLKADGTIALATAGSEAMSVDASGNVIIQGDLTVNGDLNGSGIDFPATPGSDGQILQYSGGNLVNADIPSGFPVGGVVPFAGTSAPDGWILCYGQVLNSTSSPEYADLYTVIGNTYGGSDNTDFQVPDLRGVVVAGKDDMGGVTGSYDLTSTYGPTGSTLGSTGGEQSSTLVAANNGPHDHYLFYNTTGGTNYISNPEHTVDKGGAGGAGNNEYSMRGRSGTANIGKSSSSGSGTAFSNMQPTIILNYIIKY